MSTRLRLLLLPLALLLLAPAAASAQSFAENPLVYVFVVDGLDGDRVDQGRAPYISRLLAGSEGARSTYYRESRSIMVAETNPNHAAMATGAYADRSGIPGNAFAIQGATENDDSCAPAPGGGGVVTAVSGENANCLQAETFFQAVERQRNPGDITTAGIFGKPKLGRIFAARQADGSLFADFLTAPCETQESSNPAYCTERIEDFPATGTAVNDGEVMDEVIRTIDQGVPADGRTKLPNLTFVNFSQVDQAGHATGAGSAYDAAIGMADTEIERFVETQKRKGLWSRTAMILLADHSMDSTPEKTSLAQRFTAAGIPSSAYEIVQNGSASLVYVANRADPGRFDLLRRMRAAAQGPEAALGLSPVTEVLYREDNPTDGGAANTVRSKHPAWRLEGDRVGDLVVTHRSGGAFSDPVNPLAGNHGGPQTRDNFFAVVGGGDFVRQQSLSGMAVMSGPNIFDDTLANPGQAENVDVAPTVLRLLGRSAPAQNSGRFLEEAFNLAKIKGLGGAAQTRRRIRLTVTPSRVRVGRRVRFRFRATVRSNDDIVPRINCPRSGARRSQACKSSHRVVPVRRALIRFAGKRFRTDRRGRATRVLRLGRTGRRTARATRSGFRQGTDRVRALPALRDPQLTG